MIQYENQCVDCGLPCIHNSCPYYNVEMHYCDECGDYAGYIIDNTDYCETCAKEFIKREFDELTLQEQAEIMNIVIEKIE